MNQNTGREAIPVGRFSTDKQSEGDSIKRQHDSFSRVCQRLNLTPSSRWKIFDRGMSGFHGEHLSNKAELGKFILALQNKQIQPDADGNLPVLVWEAVDRMTRLPQLIATDLVKQLVNAGIAIVFDEADLWIDKKTIEDKWLILQVCIDSAYNQSKRLSRRIKSVWSGKREMIKSDNPIRMRRPAWIDWDRQTEKFVLNAGADAIRYIFEQTVAGVGQRQLVHKLQSEFSPIGTSKQWNGSYIQSILNDRTVLGEFQPHQFSHERKRISVGSAKIGYYPAVIDEPLWYRAQLAKERRTKLKGPNSKFVNLFTGLVYSGIDEYPMHIQTTRAERTKCKYIQRRLVSYGSRNRSVGSCPISISYGAFQTAMLRCLSELGDVDQNDQDSKHLGRLTKVEEELAGVNGRLSKLQLACENEDIGKLETLVVTIASVEKKRAILIDEIHTIKMELSTSQNLKKSKLEFDEFNKEFSSNWITVFNPIETQPIVMQYFTQQQIASYLTKRMPVFVRTHETNSDDLHVLLLHFQDMISRLVERITVWPIKKLKKTGFIALLKLRSGATRGISYYSGGYQVVLPNSEEQLDPNRVLQVLMSKLEKQLGGETDPPIKKEIIAKTMHDAAQIWLGEIRSKMSKQSFRVIPSKIYRFIAHLGADLAPSEINKTRWDLWVVWLRGEVEANRLKIATARVCYSRARELVHSLQEQGRIATIEGLELSAARAFTQKTS